MVLSSLNTYCYYVGLIDRLTDPPLHCEAGSQNGARFFLVSMLLHSMDWKDKDVMTRYHYHYHNYYYFCYATWSFFDSYRCCGCTFGQTVGDTCVRTGGTGTGRP
jgi:hypothetical protein